MTKQMINVQAFEKRKQHHQPISMVTCYDHWSAKILNDSEIDCLLVGAALLGEDGKQVRLIDNVTFTSN